MGNGNRPTPEFRREAVRLALTSGRTRREVSKDLGLPPEKWSSLK
jgi:transposase